MAENNNQQPSNQKYYNNKPVASGFDPLVPLKKPWESLGIGLIWMAVLIPFGSAFLFGVYNPKDLAGVAGVSARRAGAAAVEEGKAVGESYCTQRYGEGNCKTDSFSLPASSITNSTKTTEADKN
jgi:hypothetical protein